MYFENKWKMPSHNERFGASGAVTRLKVCADLQVLRPSERQWKPHLRQAAGTLGVSGRKRSGQGIIDNSSGVSAGVVLWSDIEEIKISKVMSQKFLMFIVKNPQDYIDKVTNPLKKKTVEMNYKSFGSPISISANSLQTNFDSLYKLLTEKMEEYKS